MSEDDFPWPEAGRSFFQFERSRPDAYTWMNRSLTEFAHMYRRSAEHLMDLACDAPGLLNVYSLPAMYLLRHSIELSLKSMLVDADVLRESDEAVPERHGLLDLWTRLRRAMADSHLEDSPEEAELLDVVEAMITELDAADPNSMSFRYPRTRRSAGGDHLLADRFEYFDMRAFRDQAIRLTNFLDGCATKLDEYKQIHCDMAYENIWD